MPSESQAEDSKVQEVELEALARSRLEEEAKHENSTSAQVED